MVAAVRKGIPMRRVARTFGISLSVVQRWVGRAADRRLDQVDWSSQPTRVARPQNRTGADIEALVLHVRAELGKGSALGEHGAAAIHRTLIERGITAPPSVRTIGRVLVRSGALDGNRRVRTLPPPLGWYLPEVAARRAELDSFDTVSGLLLGGGVEIVVLNGISLHGGLVTSWPDHSMTAKLTVSLLVEHWTQFGLPQYAQFDNGNIFVGSNRYPDVISQVMRTCLLLGVIPVFAPPREPGFKRRSKVSTVDGKPRSGIASNEFRSSSCLIILTATSRLRVVAMSSASIERRRDLRCPLPPFATFRRIRMAPSFSSDAPMITESSQSSDVAS
jgi:hypothetical protein